MTSADDFHLISWRNFFGLSAVVVGVLIPVGMRFALRRRVGDVALAEDPVSEEEESQIYIVTSDEGDTVLAQGPRAGLVKGKAAPPQLVLLSDSEEEEDVLEEEEDEILEVGPALIPDDDGKGKGNSISNDLNTEPTAKASTGHDRTVTSRSSEHLL